MIKIEDIEIMHSNPLAISRILQKSAWTKVHGKLNAGQKVL